MPAVRRGVTTSRRACSAIETPTRRFDRDALDDTSMNALRTHVVRLVQEPEELPLVEQLAEIF